MSDREPPLDPQAPMRRQALTARLIRLAALAPSAVMAAAALFGRDVARPLPLVAALLAIVVVIAFGLTADRLAALNREEPPISTAVIGVIATVAGVAALTVGFGPGRERLTIVFGVVIVGAAFVLPDPQRRPVIVCAIAGWAVTLAVDGVGRPIEFVTQIGGAVALAVVALLCTGALESALAVERQASRVSRTRASLLASVLRLQALEPAAVAEAVVRGARDTGLDSAALQVVDGPDLRLVAARPYEGQEPPPLVLPAGRGLASLARRTGEPVIVDEYREHPDHIEGSAQIRGAIAMPVFVEGELAAVLVAGRLQRGLTELQIQAIELLAEEAGQALARARRFAADASTVAELRRLDEQTHDFVSTVSHELRTPMTVVNGLGQTLERRWDDLTPQRRADLLRRIDQNAERLAVMVRSLVDTSALERGQLVARTRRVDLRDCVAGVLGRLAPLFEQHPVHVELADDVAVEADPSLLEHVVENLLTNAARHTPPGTHVWVRAGMRGGEVELEVADDGPGIASEDLPHVLERFYRAGAPTTRPSGGLGLGLALSRQIVEAHGRELRVRSAPDGGTSFAFRLPVAAPTEHEGTDDRPDAADRPGDASATRG